MLICGDMNGHVGAEVDGFEGVHGGYGFGRRNVDGEMLLEFADALDFDIVNTWFKKEVRKMITYETKACKTVIDFFLIRKSERKLVRDVKVVHAECIKQHELLICVLDLKEKLQNTLARVDAQKPRFCHITPVLSDLHWLPVRHRISFKIATVTFRVLQSQQPSYLSSLIPRYVPARPLRSFFVSVNLRSST